LLDIIICWIQKNKSMNKFMKIFEIIFNWKLLVLIVEKNFEFFISKYSFLESVGIEKPKIFLLSISKINKFSITPNKGNNKAPDVVNTRLKIFDINEFGIFLQIF